MTLRLKTKQSKRARKKSLGSKKSATLEGFSGKTKKTIAQVSTNLKSLFFFLQR